MNQIINLILRLFAGPAMRRGMDHLARRGKPVAQMTSDERAQAASARQTAKRARQAIRIARRLGR